MRETKMLSLHVQKNVQLIDEDQKKIKTKLSHFVSD